MQTPLRILVVGQDSTSIANIEEKLTSHDLPWDIRQSTSPSQILAEINHHPCDAIVVSCSISESDRNCMVKGIRSQSNLELLPIVVVVGADDDEYARQAIDLDILTILRSPLHSEELAIAVQNGIGQSKRLARLQGRIAELEQSEGERVKELDKLQRNVICRLAKTGEYRDEKTGHHVIRVGLSSRLLAQALDMSEEFVDSIHLASPLHDIGKIGISEKILLKPGPLNREERQTMEEHCKIGFNILSDRNALGEPTEQWNHLEKSDAIQNHPILAMAAEIAQYHHERWDGLGYPHGLQGDDIPIAARIVGVADVFDALTHVRPYKEARPIREAIKIMDRQTGKHFDPAVMRAFHQCQIEMIEITNLNSSPNTRMAA